MKKLLILFLLMFNVFFSYGEDKNRILKEDLPLVSIQFIERYYNDFNVDYCLIDKSFFRPIEYDVFLSNGVKIEFDKNGYLKTIITSERTGVNICMLPVAIRKYIIKNYNNCYVYGYSIEYRGKSYEEHEVYLSNGYKIIFNRNSCLVEVDR